jgi:hypothetical protein
MLFALGPTGSARGRKCVMTRSWNPFAENVKNVSVEALASLIVK